MPLSPQARLKGWPTWTQPGRPAFLRCRRVHTTDHKSEAGFPFQTISRSAGGRPFRSQVVAHTGNSPLRSCNFVRHKLLNSLFQSGPEQTIPGW